MNRWSYKNLIEDINVVKKLNSEFCEEHYNYNILIVIGPKYASPFAVPLKERLAFISRFEQSFGPIINDNIKYKSLKLNHLHNILSLKNDTLKIDDDLIQLSNEWEQQINIIRR